MLKPLMSTVLIILLDVSTTAQTVVTFDVEQPAQFVVDAGQDQLYSGTPITLGGQPTAVGGGGSYSYAWEPSAILSDPSDPNPTLDALTATTAFTVTVTDQSGGCVKTDMIHVTLDVTQGVLTASSQGLSLSPNPATAEVWVRSDTELASICVRTLSGKQVVLWASPSGRSAVLDVHSLSDGIYLVTISTVNGSLITRKLCKATSDF